MLFVPRVTSLWLLISATAVVDSSVHQELPSFMHRAKGPGRWLTKSHHSPSSVQLCSFSPPPIKYRDKDTDIKILKWVPGWTASFALPERLLEMQSLRSHPKPTGWYSALYKDLQIILTNTKIWDALVWIILCIGKKNVWPKETHHLPVCLLCFW